MNIKSLLLGSAAALLAVSGARAADAVVMAEPEPVDYVRVCDVYGAGFYYIPGTETCLSISGYVWYQIGFNGYSDINDTTGYIGGTTGDGWLKTTRARVNFDARSETEWGTLRGFIRLQASWGTPNDGPVVADQAWLSLGGLQMGYTESAWAASFGGGATNWGSHSWGGMYYGYAQVHQISYTYHGGNGLLATLSLEDDALAGEGYVPDVVGKIGVNQGWGSVWAKAGYDDSYNALGDSGWGASVGLQWNVQSMPGSSLRLIGYYSDSDNRMGSGAPGITGGGLGTSEWSILASYNHQFSPNLGVSVAGQYFNDLYLAGTDLSSGLHAWGAEISAVWTPVQNFEIRPEIHYDKVETFDGTVSGFLRFTRYF